MNQTAETYFTDGCGRCAKGGTPACKVNTWAAELAALRALVLEAGLTEECKWGVPCYTFEKGNVVLIHSFKEYCALLFIKGALLKDAKGILIQQTENVRCSPSAGTFSSSVIAGSGRVPWPLPLPISTRAPTLNQSSSQALRMTHSSPSSRTLPSRRSADQK